MSKMFDIASFGAEIETFAGVAGGKRGRAASAERQVANAWDSPGLGVLWGGPKNETVDGKAVDHWKRLGAMVAQVNAARKANGGGAKLRIFPLPPPKGGDPLRLVVGVSTSASIKAAWHSMDSEQHAEFIRDLDAGWDGYLIAPAAPADKAPAKPVKGSKAPAGK